MAFLVQGEVSDASADLCLQVLAVINLGAPSMQIVPTLGSQVYK